MNRMLHAWRYKFNLPLRIYLACLASSLLRGKFSPVEDKNHISPKPCNILYSSILYY